MVRLALTLALLGGCTCKSRKALPIGTDADADTDADTDSESDTNFDAGPCNGHIGEHMASEGAGHCAYDAGPDANGCGYVTWEQNPPSSGMHCPIWERDWGEHIEIVDRCNWVHNLEHGWIVLLHNCGETPCDEELAIMRQVLQESPREASGDSRILMTEDPLLDTRFAAVSWTWAWKGDDVDLETLRCFVQWHYGNGREGAGMPDGGMVFDAAPPGDAAPDAAADAAVDAALDSGL